MDLFPCATISAKIIQLKAKGREVNVSLDIESLKQGRDFIAKLEGEWDKRLMKLKEIA